MIVVSNEKEAFITVDGQKLYGLQDLLLWIYNSSKDDFYYHFAGKHFSNWIRESLKEERLAKRIEEAKNKEEVIKILEEYLKNYEKYNKRKYRREEAEIEFIKNFEL
ncbi:MAG: hypothetical protein ACP5G1_02140 [Nanopusillaceae archaeon]